MNPSPLAEEAARLVEAVQQWVAGAQAGLPLATDAPECRLCPVCRALGALRGTRPEVFEHLSEAATALLAALRGAVAAHEHQHSPARGGAPGVEHIDVGE